jgi:hypothetical protein
METEDKVDILKEKIQARKNEWGNWHSKNPSIWLAFEKFSLEAAASGRPRYSHWAVMNRVRWHTTIETTGKEFKISNDHIAFYARAFCAKHLQHKEFFRFKPLKEELEIRRLRGLEP